MAIQLDIWQQQEIIIATTTHEENKSVNAMTVEEEWRPCMLQLMYRRHNGTNDLNIFIKPFNGKSAKECI